MKPSGFDIIELFRNNYKLEAHAMNKSITQAAQDDKQISKSIKKFLSMYMNLITGRNAPVFAKDTVYRFMKMIQINRIRFTTILSSRIIKDAIIPPDSEDRANVLIIDDSVFERNHSKKVELLAKVYDHAKHKYRFGFRMLTLGWSDGSTFLQKWFMPATATNVRSTSV